MFNDLVKNSRTARAYDNSVKVSEKDLKEMIEISRFVPSAKNQQAFKYSIISN